MECQPEPSGAHERQRGEARAAFLGAFRAALEELFSARVAAARIERIVERAGGVLGAFSVHLTAKDRALQALTDRTEALIADSLVLRDDAPLAEALHTIFEQTKSAMHAVQGEVRRELIAAQLRRPRRASALPSPLHARLAQVIAHAQQRRLVRADLDALDVSRTLLASMFGAVALSADDETASSSLSLLIELALHGALLDRAPTEHE
ncbi:MAG: hypothetical protein HYS27_27545 [Deltaproteobacteria bacterium]|nr:hypothetical protein [Deltaproteobacteria bacterium]